MPLGLRIKLLYPQFLVIIFVLASFAPVRITNFDILFPLVDMMLIYYWCIYRPELLPNWFVFVVGIFKDILTGVPIGINALANLIMRSITRYKRDSYVKHPFIVVWQGFALFLSITIFSKWVVFSIINNEFVNIKYVMVQLFITIIIYPLFHLLFSSVYSILPKKRSHA